MPAKIVYNEEPQPEVKIYDDCEESKDLEIELEEEEEQND